MRAERRDGSDEFESTEAALSTEDLARLELDMLRRRDTVQFVGSRVATPFL